MSSSRRIFQPGGVLSSSNGGNSYPNVSTYHSTSPGHSTMGSRSPHTSSTTTNHSSPHGTTSHGGTISLRRSHPAPANGPHDGKEIRPFGITNSSRTALRYGFNAAVRGTHVQTSSSGSSSSPSHASRNTIGTGTRRPIGSYFMTSPLQSLIAPQIGYGPTNITSASSSSKASVNTGSNAHYRSPHARSAGRHGAGVSWLSNQRATGSASTPGATPTVSSPMSGSGAVEIHTPPGLSTTVTGRHQVPLIYGPPQTSSSKEGIHSNSTSNNNNNKALRYQTKVLTNNYVVTSKNSSSSSPQGSDRDASALIIEGASAENKASFFSSISMKETNSGLNNSTAPPKPTEFFLDLDSIDARLNIVKKGRLSGRSGSSGSPTNTQRGSSVGTDNVTGSSIGGAVVEGSIGPATLSCSGSPVPQIPAICSHETSATPLSLIEDHGPLQATTGTINSFSTDRSLSSPALELSVFGLSQSVEDQTVHSPSVNYSVVASCGLPSEETIEHSFEQNEVKTENTEESREVSFTVPNAPPEKKVKATPSRTHRRSTNTTKNIDDRAHTGIDVTVHYQRNNANDSEKIINTISPSKQLVEVSQSIDMYSESTQHSSLQTFVLAPESVDEEEPLAQMNDKEPCSVLNSLVHHLFNHYFKSPVLSMLTQTPTPSPQKELLKVESNTVQNDIVDVPEQEATVSSPYGFHIPIPLLDDNESLRTPPRTRKCSYPDP